MLGHGMYACKALEDELVYFPMDTGFNLEKVEGCFDQGQNRVGAQIR